MEGGGEETSLCKGQRGIEDVFFMMSLDRSEKWSQKKELAENWKISKLYFLHYKMCLFRKKAAFVKDHFALLFQPALEKMHFSSLVRVWKCEGFWFEHLVFIWAEKRGWIRNKVFVVPDTVVGPSPVWHRNSPWLRERTNAHYWAPLWWLAGSPFTIRKQGLPLNRNGEVGRLLRGAASSAALTLPLPRLASGWRYGSSITPGSFSSLFFNQLSLSCQKLEVERLGESKWMVCNIKSLGCCSGCTALGNTGCISGGLCNKQGWCGVRHIFMPILMTPLLIIIMLLLYHKSK